MKRFLIVLCTSVVLLFGFQSSSMVHYDGCSVCESSFQQPTIRCSKCGGAMNLVNSYVIKAPGTGEVVEYVCIFKCENNHSYHKRSQEPCFGRMDGGKTDEQEAPLCPICKQNYRLTSADVESVWTKCSACHGTGEMESLSSSGRIVKITCPYCKEWRAMGKVGQYLNPPPNKAPKGWVCGHCGGHFSKGLILLKKVKGKDLYYRGN